MQEPARTKRIHDWVDEWEPKHDGMVLIRFNSYRKGWKFPLRSGEEFAVPPSGHRTNRRVALELIEKFGPGSSYIGRDVRTGVTQADLMAMHPETRAYFEKQELRFIPDFLVHVPDVPKSQPEAPAPAYNYDDVPPSVEDTEEEE